MATPITHVSSIGVIDSIFLAYYSLIASIDKFSMAYICPVPATFLVSDPKQAADALLAQVQKQFDGHPVSPIALEYTTETHKGFSRKRR